MRGHAPLGAVGGGCGTFQPDKPDRSINVGAAQTAPVLYS